MIWIHDLRGQLRDLRQTTAEAVRSVLDDAQLAKWNEVRAAAPLVPVIRAFHHLGLIPRPEPGVEDFADLP